jgi:hypothetical protein
MVEAPGVEGRGETHDLKRLEAVSEENGRDIAGSGAVEEGPESVSDGLAQIRCSGVVEPGGAEAVGLEAGDGPATAATAQGPAEHPGLSHSTTCSSQPTLCWARGAG